MRKENLTIIAHDAGGAELLANFIIRENHKYNITTFLEGPAVGIFKRYFTNLKTNQPLSEVIATADWCLCGSSWQSDLEWEAINLALNNDIHVATFLDHWVNYEQRFIRNGKKILPNEIWIGDVYGMKLANNIFPNIPIKFIHNPYFQNINAQLVKLEARNPNELVKNRALFIGENISTHAELRYGNKYYWGYTELEALEYFLTNMDKISHKINEVIIRPHPSENFEKYLAAQNKYPNLLSFSNNESLLEDILSVSTVAGCQSMAMVIALIAKKNVVCVIPPSKGFCNLPQDGIIHLRELR